MKTPPRGHLRDFGSAEKRWSEERPREAFGPQGAALILELRRIQRAFDREVDGGARAAPRVDEPKRGHAARSKRTRPAPLRDSETIVSNRSPGRWFRFLRARDDLAEVDKVENPVHRALPPTVEHDDRRERRDRQERLPAGEGDPSESSRLQALLESQLQLLRRVRANIASGVATERGVDDRTRAENGPLSEARAHRDAARQLIRAGVHALQSSVAFLLNRGSGGRPGDLQDASLAVQLRNGFENEFRQGLRVLVVAGGLLGGWAALVPLSAAVVVAGTLVVQSNVKKIQHPTGGVIAEIPVHNGMHVKEGDLVVRLDATQARANLQVIAKQLDAIRLRIARLIAERDGLDELNVPRELAARMGDPEVAQLVNAEKSLFKARASARQNQKELLRRHIAQLNEEIAGLDAQIKAKASQLDLIARELQGVQALYDKQLVPLTRLTTLQREAARLEGERGQLLSGLAEAQAKISEEELQIVKIDQDLRTEVMKDLRESQDKEAELAERNIAAQDLANRIDMRAPTSGVINELAVHTIGGVVGPGEVIMEIVPDSDDLLIEAKLPPNDIDQVRLGQSANVRFSAFNQRTTPQLSGKVSYVSADVSHDKQTNAAFYTVRVTLPGSEIRRLGGLQLVSGMPAEVFLQTGSRTMMSYLFKPITDQLQRMFSER
jgi:HlyD family secretion protein